MISLDSNILYYAVDPDAGAKHIFAADLVARLRPGSSFLTQQAIGEFLNVCRRRARLATRDAIEQVEAWATFFEIVPTMPDQLLDAARLAERRKKQFWDMVILTVAADGGAKVLISEDIGDGEVIEGVRILNPFDPANRQALEAILTPSS